VYLGDSPFELQVGDRRVKAVDPWRTGLLAAFVPGYALYWWYRSAAELRALGVDSGNDNIRLNPVLMLVLVLFAGTLVPLIVAIVLLSEAIKAAQEQQQTRVRISTSTNLLLLVSVWFAAPLVLVLVALMGGSAGAILLSTLCAIPVSVALNLILYEQLQFHLNSIWLARRGTASVRLESIAEPVELQPA
jgi:hypothetical protein